MRTLASSLFGAKILRMGWLNEKYQAQIKKYIKIGKNNELNKDKTA